MRKPSLLVLVCLVLAAGALRAQAPGYNVRIYAVGGFLGYKEGLTDPEDPKKANGGLFAVQDWLDTGFVGDRDLLVVTGNNLSLETADHAVGELGADAVAVSIDDFLRSLRQPDHAADFVHRLQRNDQPPFVASNAIIRVKKKGLNKVDGDGVDLEIGEDASIGWVSRLQASCDDDCPSVATATLSESTPCTGARGDRGDSHSRGTAGI